MSIYGLWYYYIIIKLKAIVIDKINVIYH